MHADSSPWDPQFLERWAPRLLQARAETLERLVSAVQWAGEQESCPWCGAELAKVLHLAHCPAASVMGWRVGEPPPPPPMPAARGEAQPFIRQAETVDRSGSPAELADLADEREGGD